MFGRQGEIGLHRSAASRQDHERDALFAAAERKELAAQKFEEWVRFKDSFDRGLALFAKLDPSHCEVRKPRTQKNGHECNWKDSLDTCSREHFDYTLDSHRRGGRYRCFQFYHACLGLCFIYAAACARCIFE